MIGFSRSTWKRLEPIDPRVHIPASKLSLLSQGSGYASGHEWVLKHLGKVGPKTVSWTGGRAVVCLRWALPCLPAWYLIMNSIWLFIPCIQDFAATWLCSGTWRRPNRKIEYYIAPTVVTVLFTEEGDGLHRGRCSLYCPRS